MHKNKKSTSAKELNDECNCFCRYLVNERPDHYILKKYLEAHHEESISGHFNASSFDVLLSKIARINPFFTNLVDSYAVLFYKTSVVRKKLILLLAILECSAMAHAYFDSKNQRGKLTSYLKIIYKSLLSLSVFLLSIVILTPFHLGSKISSNLAIGYRRLDG